MRKKDKKIKFN